MHAMARRLDSQDIANQRLRIHSGPCWSGMVFFWHGVCVLLLCTQLNYDDDQGLSCGMHIRETLGRNSV